MFSAHEKKLVLNIVTSVLINRYYTHNALEVINTLYTNTEISAAFVRLNRRNNLRMGR